MYIKLFLILSSIVLGDIPKRIIQTGPNEEVEEFKGIPGRMQVKNEDFSYDFFNDDRMFEFMQEHFPESELLEVFLDERVPIVMKSDLFRLAVVASIGGFYMDMDVYAYKNMEPLLKEKAVFPKEWKKNDEDFEARHGTLPEDEEERWQVGNYAFGSEANHPLVLDALEEAVKRTKALLEEEGELQDDDVLKSTGRTCFPKCSTKEEKRENTMTSISLKVEIRFLCFQNPMVPESGISLVITQSMLSPTLGFDEDLQQRKS